MQAHITCAVVSLLFVSTAAAQRMLTPRDAVIHTSGSAVASLGDQNGDGPHELITGSTIGFADGIAQIVSGADGSILRTLEPPNAEESRAFGLVVGAVGDLTGDGFRDAVVYDARFSAEDGRFWGRLHAYDAVSGDLLWSLNRPSTIEPMTIIAIPDIDADGTPDIATNRANIDERGFGLIAISGADGRILWQTEPAPEPAIESLGPVTLIPDMDGDGVEDLAAASLTGSPTIITLVSSATGAEITRFAAQGPRSRHISIARMPDLSGDGVDDLAVGQAFQPIVDGRVGLVTAHALPGGEVLREWTPPRAESASFGRSVAAVPDLDGDGRAELVIAKALFEGPDEEQAPFVAIYSGAAQSPSFFIEGETDMFGQGMRASQGIVPTRDSNGAPAFIVLAPGFAVSPQLGARRNAGVLVFAPDNACRADLNFDGAIDGADLGSLLGVWSARWAQRPRFDLDGSDRVDAGDLSLLVASWGICAK